MTTEKIQYDVVVTGAETAAAGFQRVGDSAGKASVAGTAFKAQIAGTSTAVGGLVSALSAADPRIAQFTFAIGGARAAVGGLMAAIGGVGGLAAGVAVGGAIAALSYFTRAQKEAEEQALRMAAALDKEAKALRDVSNAAAQKYGPAKSDYQRIGEEILGLESQQRLAKRAGEHATADRLGQSIADAKYQQEQALAAARNARDRAQLENELDVLAGEGRLPGTGGRRKGSTEFDRMQEVDAQIARLKAMEAAPGEARAGAALADEQSRANARVEAFRAGLEQEFEIENEMRSEQRALQLEAYEEHLREVEMSRKETMQSLLNIGEFAGQSFTKGLAEMAKGHKVHVARILEGIGDQMVAEGTHMLFKAAAYAFIPGMQGSAGGLAGVGAAEIAAGIALGAASARSSAGGGGGGLGTARPVMSVDTARDDRPIIINLTNSIGPSPGLGVAVRDSERMAVSVHGTSGF